MKKSMKCKKLVAIAMTAAMFLSAGMSVFAGKSTVKKRGDSVSVRTNHSYSDDDDWDDDDWDEDEDYDPDQCGKNIRWSLDENTGTLTLTGSGNMWDFDFTAINLFGWAYDYENERYISDKVKKVVFNGNITSIGASAFATCRNLKSIDIPNTVKKIGWNAFAGSGVSEINIPSSVSSIDFPIDNGSFIIDDDDNFIELESLMTRINVDSNNTRFSSIDGVLFNKDKTEIVSYPEGRKGDYTIPSSVKYINKDAFCYSNISNIFIPNSVMIIRECAFYSCTGLKNVIIPNSVTVIEGGAFAECSSLENVTIPKSIEAIGMGAFVWYDEDGEISAVKDIYYEGSEAEWNSIRTVNFLYEEGDDSDFHDNYKDSTIHFNYQPTAAVSITQQPANQTINLGDSVKLTVKAEGADLSYQWYFKKAGQTAWSVWKGHTRATETATPNATWNGIQLYCEVKDSSGNTVNSEAAKITVKLPLSVTQQPANQTVKLGDSIKLSVKAEGTGLSYQWYFKKSGQTAWSVWKTRTHATETVTPNATWNGIQLYCQVKDNAGNTVKSDAAKITVLIPAKVTQQPASQTVKLGDSLTLSVKAEGTGLKYQWYFKKAGQTAWSVWKGRTGASETVTPNATWDGIQLYCEVKGNYGNTVKSDAAKITVTQPLKITQQPTNQTVSLGNSIKVTVKAEGKGLTYQWYFKKKGQTSWSVWKGRTHASETVTPNATWNGIQLYCEVTDSAGTKANSGVATITVK